LPRTAAQHREQIQPQVELANALMHTKGYGAPETKVSFGLGARLAGRERFAFGVRISAITEGLAKPD